MNKEELLQDVKERTGLSTKESRNAVDAFLDAIVIGLSKGENVYLRGFGTFRISQRKARTVRNPKTGEKSEMGPRKSALFKAGKVLKHMVNDFSEKSS